MSSSSSSEKTFYFIRHGLTEMNEYLHRVPWGSKHFSEPFLHDTRLSPQGVAQCQEAHRALARQLLPPHRGTVAGVTGVAAGGQVALPFDQIDLVVTSPLTRTIQTANYLLYGTSHPLVSPQVKKIVQPLLAERVYMVSDTGRHKESLIEDFPDYDFSLLPSREWWYEHDEREHQPYVEWRPPDGQYKIFGEPEYLFRQRLLQARQWLLSLEQNHVIVVSHWGVLRGLTGFDFRNLEIRRVQASELLPEPFIDP
eukprot:gene6161-6790_t